MAPQAWVGQGAEGVQQLRKQGRCQGCCSPRTDPRTGRCSSCGTRTELLAKSIFAGLRCGPEGVQRLLLAYAELDLAVAPQVTALVAATKMGRSCVEHFVGCLRELEAEAGARICEEASLSGNVECDGSFLTSFHISAENVHYYHQIYRLRQMDGKNGVPVKKMPRVYKAYVMVLGLQPRGGTPIIHLGEPCVTPKGVRLDLTNDIFLTPEP